jgi:Uma2 family endonuclease
LDEDRVPQPLPADQFEGAPDFVTEILSPSNWREDMEEKRPAYQQAGVRELWFVDPEEQQITVDRRRGRKYVTTTITTRQLSSTVLQGFWIDPAWLWADPLPSVMTCLRQILGE